MNFYKRYMADYARKTARLSLIEHGAYNLLLDEFYSSEEPLPLASEDLHRICRAFSKDERKAVDRVAELYFPVVEGVRTNGRAEEELGKAEPAMEAARSNGKRGGRPKKEPSDNPVGSIQKPSRNPAVTQHVTQKKPRTKATHSSDVSSSLRSEETAPVSALMANGFDAQTAEDFIAHKARVGAPLTPRAWADHLAESLKAGWSPVAAATKVMARNWKGFEAKYVNESKTQHKPTGFNGRKDRQLATAGLMTGAMQIVEVIDVDAIPAP